VYQAVQGSSVKNQVTCEDKNYLAITHIIHFFFYLPCKAAVTTAGCGSNNPCSNSGVCVSTAVGYQCQCAGGFSGTNCQSNTGIKNSI